MLMSRYSEQDKHTDKTFVGKHGHASPHHTTVAAHTKMRLLSKVEQNMRQHQQNQNHNPGQLTNPGQNQSINKLIQTAASGNRLMGDVDELLTPMRTKDRDMTDRDYSPNGHKDSSSRPERNLWSRAEMLEMLQIMQNMNALDQLNDRNVKSEHVFRQIEDVMRSKGYVKKSSIQIWTKWKFLKSTYNTTTRHGNGIPKVVPEEVYRVLSRMLSEHGGAGGGGGGGGGNSSGSGINIGSECGNSMDSSNAELRKTTTESDDVKDELGVEHPIFGFRLGLVKPEPLDNGYETTLHQSNSSEQEIEAVDFVHHSNSDSSLPAQTLEHTPFLVTTVKHEPEMDLGMDGTNTPPPTAPTSPSPPPPPAAAAATVVVAPPLAPLAPLAPPSMQSTLGGVEQRELSTSLPPLRVAAFASDTRRMMNSTPNHGVLQIERPAALVVGKTAGAAVAGAAVANPVKGQRSLPLQSTSSINFVHPTSKLMLPRKQLPLRIPREISLQPASTRPLKAVPVRDTGYSLRPDRMIPDLEQSISPPQSPSPPLAVPTALHSQLGPKYSMPYASTSRHAQQLNEQLHPMRKRRFDSSPVHVPMPVPVKLQRSSAPSYKPPVEEQQQQQRTKLALEEAQRRKQQQQQQQEEIFKKELGQLASAMRVAQKEMLEDFFQRQKQFARREHEFQLRQDNLVMSALRKQTDALLQTARQLIETEQQQQQVGVQQHSKAEAHELLEEEEEHDEEEEHEQMEAEYDEDDDDDDDDVEADAMEAEEEEHEHEHDNGEQEEEEEEHDEEQEQEHDEEAYSESAMVISNLALSEEDASSNSGIPNDRQLSS